MTRWFSNSCPMPTICQKSAIISVALC